MDKKIILIVDDDPRVRKTLSDIFKGKGYIPRAAATGKEGIEWAKEEEYPVALIDLKLDDMSGLEVMREIRECRPATKCIVLTGYASQKSAIEAANLGAYSYLQKPYDVDQLLLTVLRAFEKREAEEEVKKSEKKYRSLVETITDIVFTLDENGRVIYLNPVFEKITGCSSENFVGRFFDELLTPECRDKINDHFRQNSREKTTRVYEIEFAGKHVKKIPLELNETLLFDSDGTAIGRIGIARDTSERKRAQEEKQKLETRLAYAQKMEALGTLAGGIAHDFNNLLMGIQGNATLMLLDIDSTHPHYERLEHVNQYVESGANLTKQLLGFARGGKFDVKPADLNGIVNKTSGMFGRTRKEIKIYRKHQENIWTVEVDQGQIEQVLLNIYVNAWQAMPVGGELYLKTENVFFGEELAKPFTVEPGKYVRISVTDTGAGMDRETSERVFEPFFTTREFGRGTGLGLASAYGIIKNHGGYINVYSEEGKGTTFNIYLPVSKAVAVDQGAGGIEEQILKGDETILLVDDEDMILDVANDMLNILGYRVVLARSAKEALQVYETNKDKVDMVILDMIMPGMGGKDAFELMKKVNPDIKVLFSSGYGFPGQMDETLRCGSNGFIQKPFDMRELSRKIREILE